MGQRGRYFTCLENTMQIALEQANISVVPEFPIRCKYGYILDFAIPDLKICIECDGEKWHPIGNKHDRNRDGFLRGVGWTIIRFRGKEIEENIEECIKKIQEVINVQLIIREVTK